MKEIVIGMNRCLLQHSLPNLSEYVDSRLAGLIAHSRPAGAALHIGSAHSRRLSGAKETLPDSTLPKNLPLMNARKPNKAPGPWCKWGRMAANGRRSG